MILDSLDLRILDELQRDGSLSNVDLARRVHLSPSPCLARVKALMAGGVIDRYVAIAIAAALGLGLNVFISISLRRCRSQSLDGLHGRCSAESPTKAQENATCCIRSAAACAHFRHEQSSPLQRASRR